jgi:hypothetical protein
MTTDETANLNTAVAAWINHKTDCRACIHVRPGDTTTWNATCLPGAQLLKDLILARLTTD